MDGCGVCNTPIQSTLHRPTVRQTNKTKQPPLVRLGHQPTSGRYTRGRYTCRDAKDESDLEGHLTKMSISATMPL